MMRKRLRYADRLAAEDPLVRLRDVHLLIGGTGAVGGATLMKMLRIYGDLRRRHRLGDDVVGPVIVATGHDEHELQRFRAYVYDVCISESGKKPTTSSHGHTLRMPNGALIELMAFKFDVLPGLEAVLERERDSLLDALLSEVRSSRAFTDLLGKVDDDIRERTQFERYRSVQIGIPLPSLMAYHLDSVDELETKGLLSAAETERVKEAVEQQLVAQLREVRARADHVLVAHTTAVGGMYDVDGQGRSTIRLGFAHAAIDSQLLIKRQRAEQFSRLYREAGIWNLVTAAAVGIDNVAIDEPLKLQKQMEKSLQHAAHEPFPAASTAKYIHVHPPKSVRAASSSSAPLHFERMARGHELRPRFALRSGENGFLSVANAEALYRVMRVASPSELGTVMGLVGALGDDPKEKWFPDGVCYYTETDNSRLVFDFLSQPQLRDMQLSGLEPQALVDLGSAKHQAELHTLGLLILLHRLRTLDLDAVPAKRTQAAASQFDVESFIADNSRPLTFEDVQQWSLPELERDLRILALAETPDDLLPLKDFHAKNQDALSGYRAQVRTEILRRVLHAVWAVTSLGSPLIVNGDDGEPLIRTGWWVAPLSIVAEREDSIAAWFTRRSEQLAAWGRSPEELARHHFAVNGFVDLRMHAIVGSSKTDAAPPDTVVVAHDEAALRGALAKLTPYSFFATCGLLAVHYRLKSLGDYIQAAQTQIQLGTHHDVAWAIPRDHRQHTLVVPGIVESLRMVSEGLEKATGTEILSGNWGYQWSG
jgi:hypothetical protein